MSSYVYELPTTGNLVFSEVLSDRAGRYTHAIANATVARSNLRTTLKESKRTEDGEKDYLRIVKVIDEYLPQLYAIIDCVRTGDLELRQLPMFSWRSTLSSNILNNSPRQNVPGFLADLSFTLLTYGFALSNLAASCLTSLGSYERDRTILNEQRLVKDEKLNFTVQLLMKSAGVFAHVAQVVLPEWERTLDERSSGINRPVDLSKELVLGLSRFALAEAQTLTIRKLMSKSAYDSTLTPGPPLPKSHPKPGFIAKISLNALENYTSALSLCKSAKGGVSGSGSGVSGLQKATEVTKDVTRWIKDETDLMSALSHKWLGVDAGETGIGGSGSGINTGGKAGEAVGFLQWALEELEELKGRDGGHGIPGLGRKKTRKERVAEEIASTAAFLNHYRKLNNTIHFEPVPPIASLRNMIPSGTAVVEIKPFTPPVPAFRSSTSSNAQNTTNTMNTTLTQDIQNTTNTGTGYARNAGASVNALAGADIDPLERRLNATHLDENDGVGEGHVPAGIGAVAVDTATAAGATAPQAGTPAKDPGSNPRAAYF